jgi:hypothetical protein
LILLPFVLFAQTNSVPDLPDNGEGPVFPPAESWVLMLSSVVGALATAGVKKIAPKIPKLMLPLLATGLGTLGAYLGTMAIGDGTPFLLALGVGLANVGVREVIDQLSKTTGVKAATKMLLALCLAGTVTVVGCKILNPDTGEYEYDPVTTEQVKSTVKPFVVSTVRRIIIANPDTANYFTLSAQTFDKMRDDKAFEPSILIKALDEAAKNEGWYGSEDEWIQVGLDFKDALIAFYEVYYAQRFKAALPEDEFLFHVTDLIADALAQGVTEATPSQ